MFKITKTRIFLTPKGIRSALKMPQVPPPETRTQLPGLYFFIFMNVATPSNVLSFLVKSHVNTAIYILTDCTRKIRNIVAHDLLLATQGHYIVNRNYVNPAVKFRYPNAIELRPLKCCICPKLTPGLKNFEHGNACFVHLVTLMNLYEMSKANLVPCIKLLGI